MKAKKIVKIFIYLSITLLLFLFLFLPILLVASGVYNKPNEPRVTAYEDDLAGTGVNSNW